MVTTQDMANAITHPVLPPSQLFDILPALHEILARLDHTPSTAEITRDSDGDNDLGTAYTGVQPLDPKDLPTAIAPLKSQIRKGLRELLNLPDMDRSIADQDEEIQQLETKISQQQAVLMGLAKEKMGS
ncbi:hypothetical protein LTR62_008139 [Meristemomyces frigidus]|uniref:Mediator of RNA polymerase II transcription subunit 9 n=1 Tax=Meristemomyces frigidus TaxID=1508187 RepID=A0AAN7TDY9_9PEZI|nr:hypothetical protein LTR62_008139 [Meristemomyces frigidus]